MKKTQRIITALLAIIMLLTAFPLTAAADDETAVELISLKISDPDVVIVPPTVSPTSATYGITYGELAFEGGSVTYRGNPVSGYFTCSTVGASSKIPVTEGGTKARLCFVPTGDDANIYAATNNMICTSAYEEQYGEAWPKINISPVPVKVEGVPAEITVPMGTLLSAAAKIEGVTIYNAETNEEITSGSWSWRTADGQAVDDMVLLENCEYVLRWYYRYHDEFTQSVKINIDESQYTGLGVYPTPAVPERYISMMTWGDIPLEGGTAYYLGSTISGHYEWTNPERDVASYVGKNASGTIKFVPDDEALVETMAEYTAQIYAQMPPVPVLELADGCTEMTVAFGNWYSSMRADRLGLSFKDGVDAAYVSVMFTEQSFTNATLGRYEDVAIKFVYSRDDAYENIETTLPLNLIQGETDDAFLSISARNNIYSVEGAYEIYLTFHNRGKTGTATVRVNGEIIAEGIEPSYVYGEKSKSTCISFVAPKSGNYVVTAEYIPGPNDGYVFTNPTIETSFEATVRDPITVTLIGAKSDNFIRYPGDAMKVYIDGQTVKEENFDRWVVTDANGRELTMEELGITENDLVRKYMTFTLPDYDITVKAKRIGEIDLPVIDTGTNGGEPSFFQQIANFFTNIGSYIAAFFAKIADFFTGLFGGFSLTN